MNTSSLHVVGPRRAIFDLQAQQNDCALLMKEINRDEKIKSAAKIALGILVFGVFYAVLTFGLVREDRRIEVEINNLQQQEYLISR